MNRFHDLIIPMAAIAVAAALSGCGTTPAQQATIAAGAQTLAGIAATNNTTVASLVTKGALFCKQVTGVSPLVVALANASGAPVSVTGQVSDDVATGCALIGGIPVVPPVVPGTVPVVASGTTLPAA